jgi:4-amino-4-deoxy-L-arabinose transferase-like glycosyltransferase
MSLQAAGVASRPAFLRYSSRSSLVLLLGFGFCLLAIGIGLRDPWPADEPRFALIAKEMLQTGEFWFPRRAGELYADKPPVFIWLSALAIATTGSIQAGFLLPSLLAGLGTLGLVMDLVRRLYGSRTAWLTGATLLATAQFVMQAKSSQIDMVLTFFTTLGAYGILRNALLGPSRAWWLLAWVSVGLGILTKGVGFLPLFILPAWVWLAAKGRAPRLPWTDIGAGLLVMLGVIASWGLPMILMASFGDGELAAYRDNILFKQTEERYLASWHHLQPWYFYLVEVIPWAWMPMVLGLPWAVPAWCRRIRRHDAAVILPLSAVMLILVFFSLSPGKRGVYILPAVPLLAISMAPLLPGLWVTPVMQKTAGLLLAVVSALLLAAGVAGSIGLGSLDRLALRHGVAPWHWWIFLGVVGAMLLGWLRLRRGGLALAFWLVAYWVSWSTWGYLLLESVRSPRGMMQAVATITGPQGWVAMPNFEEEFLLQARQPMVHFGYGTPSSEQLSRAFAWLQQAPDMRWMLIRQDRRADLDCIKLEHSRDLGFQNRAYWWLIPGTAFAGCQGDEHAAPLFVAPTTLTPLDGGATF